ncbi:hypothetical protein BaRGS_00011885, partial [Batillaria attramentaria]
GSLHDKIAHATELFPETDVLWYFFQITSALSYVHQYGIIHRDIKSLNIFLTKVGLLKLGDFGISKVLETKEGMADSVVGTPYYMSPELVKGEKYNFKSDIWALGCVLYELLTLSRTFQASNPLKLAYEIVQMEHESIDSQYSEEMHTLVNDMLQKEPAKRPSAEEILKSPLFSDAKELERRVWELNSSSRKLRLSTTGTGVLQPVVTSKMCEVHQWGGGKITPQKLELFRREKSPIQVSAGHYHFAAITFEKELYTWANPQGTVSMCGQLGHGDTAAYKAPKRVDALLDEGVLYGFGSNYYGCVGAAGEDEVLVPQPIEFFLDHPVLQVSCGDAHVAVLTRYGDVYTWGSGEFGKLGLGSEDDFDTPHKVDLPGKHLVKEVVAGADGTFLVCASGKLLACGSNEFNKLGFNSETSGLRKRKKKTYDIPCKNTFTTVKPLSRYSITTVAAGKTHSAAVDCFGHLFTFGSNRYGQLGLSDFRRRVSVSRVGGVLVGQQVVKVSCGDGFTVATTSENLVYAWGLGESGRLGAVFEGVGPNGQCVPRPRPIFGSMHIVPCLSSRHWNTLIIAEKVLNSKTLRTQDSRVSISPKVVSDNPTSFEPSTPGSQEDDVWLDISVCSHDADAAPGDDAQTEQVDRAMPVPPLEQIEESSIPSWLEQELEEAEVIPLPKAYGSPSISDLSSQENSTASRNGDGGDSNSVLPSEAGENVSSAPSGDRPAPCISASQDRSVSAEAGGCLDFASCSREELFELLTAHQRELRETVENQSRQLEHMIDGCRRCTEDS